MIAQRRLPTTVFNKGLARCSTVSPRRSRCPTAQRLRALNVIQKYRQRYLTAVSPRHAPLAPVNGVSAASLRQGFSLPRILPRPVVGEVNMGSLELVFPELKGVSAQYLRDQIPSFAPSMLAGLANFRLPSLQRSSLPSQIKVLPIANTGTPPTHVLALHSSAQPAHGTAKKVTLVPAHQLVLSAHCAHLPALPAATSSTSLSVVPLRLPCPGAFPLLQTYLHTKDSDVLLSAAAYTNPATAMSRAALIHGLWQDACTLGVIDAQLYDVLDQCWASVVPAFE